MLPQILQSYISFSFPVLKPFILEIHRTASIFLAVRGKKKVPVGLDIFQGVHLYLENEPNPVGVDKTTEQVEKALNI